MQTLLDLTDEPATPTRASHAAWMNRWAPWPTTVDDVTRSAWAGPEHQRLAVYACARRLHYAFAHPELETYARDALELYPGDEFLAQLHASALAAQTGDEDAWAALAERARDCPQVWGADIYLTTVFVTADPPAWVLQDALEVARAGAAAGDVVLAYRVVSFLRMQRRWDEAAAAVTAATSLLVARRPRPDFGDHITERLVLERQLIGQGRALDA